jgi:hypothetical protein
MSEVQDEAKIAGQRVSRLERVKCLRDGGIFLRRPSPADVCHTIVIAIETRHMAMLANRFIQHLIYCRACIFSRRSAG